MKRLLILILALVMFPAPDVRGEDLLSGFRDLFETPTATPSPTATPEPNAFRFRDGIRWGMSSAQVKALENVPMTERSTQTWSVMLTDEKVAVSRFTADLVFMFLQDRLLMISYEFSRSSPSEDYLYLSRALGTLYGEQQEADPLTVKALMDLINPNRYSLDQIREVMAWEAADGTLIYQYYYAGDNFALTYVSPLLGKGIYQTNGL